MDEQPNKRRGPLTWLAGRSRRFWIAIALLPLLYIASFGPACWISSRVNYGNWINFTALPTVYRPLLIPMFYHRRIAIAVYWYTELGAASGWRWINITGREEWISGEDDFAWVKMSHTPVSPPATTPDGASESN